MFGGSIGHMRHSDEMADLIYTFDTRTEMFNVPSATGVCPAPTLSAEAAVVGSKLFIFGGWCSDYDLPSDLYSIDLAPEAQ